MLKRPFRSALGYRVYFFGGQPGEGLSFRRHWSMLPVMPKYSYHEDPLTDRAAWAVLGALAGLAICAIAAIAYSAYLLL